MIPTAPSWGRDRLNLIDEALAEPGVLGMVPEDGGCRVAVIGAEVVGSVCFAERHGRGYVWGMYVLPDHRRRGLGRALLSWAARDMPDARTLDLGTVTPAAEAFYRHLGFLDAAGPDFEPFPGVTLPTRWLSIAAEALRGEPAAVLSPPA